MPKHKARIIAPCGESSAETEGSLVEVTVEPDIFETTLHKQKCSIKYMFFLTISISAGEEKRNSEDPDAPLFSEDAIKEIVQFAVNVVEERYCIFQESARGQVLDFLQRDKIIVAIFAFAYRN